MNIGVIFAGGTGKRMNTVVKPKQFLDIYNKPIIIYTLEHFENCDDIDAVVIACLEEWIPYLENLIKKYDLRKIRKIVPGGDTGQLSIYNGLLAAEEISVTNEDNIVLIHDGVRPLINPQLLSTDIETVRRTGSAITGGTVTETIVVVDDDNNIRHLPERKYSRVAKAPQCFYLKDILTAHRTALSEGRNDFIDSCSMMQYYGHKLTMVDGPHENIKITTPDDYYMMRAIIEAKENAQIYGIN